MAAWIQPRENPDFCYISAAFSLGPTINFFHIEPCTVDTGAVRAAWHTRAQGDSGPAVAWDLCPRWVTSWLLFLLTIRLVLCRPKGSGRGPTAVLPGRPCSLCLWVLKNAPPGVLRTPASLLPSSGLCGKVTPLEGCPGCPRHPPAPLLACAQLPPSRQC